MANEKFTQIEMEETFEFSSILRRQPHTDSGAFRALHNKYDGSYKTPKSFLKGFDAAIAKENIFRTYGTVIHTSQSQNMIKTALSTGEAEIINEAESYPVDADTFGSYSSKTYKIGALTKLLDEFVFDTKFNVEKYLQNEFAQRFGRAEERHFINGTGAGQPLGILTKDADITTFDTGVLTYDDVVSLYFSVKDKYARKGVFVVNRKTAMALRSMVDNNGQPIWNMNDNTIFSKPVLISEFMPDIESGSKPIFFGDLSYYWVMITQPLYISVLTEMFALEGAVGYAGHERLDGRLINDEAVAVLQVQ